MPEASNNDHDLPPGGVWRPAETGSSDVQSPSEFGKGMSWLVGHNTAARALRGVAAFGIAATGIAWLGGCGPFDRDQPVGTGSAGHDNTPVPTSTPAARSTTREASPKSSPTPAVQRPTVSTSAKPSSSKSASTVTLAMQKAYVRSLSFDEKVGLKLMPAINNEAELDRYDNLFSARHIGGIILMNEVSPGSLRSFTARQNQPFEVSTDQEGGEVQRYTSLPALPSAWQVGHTMSPKQAEMVYDRDYKGLAAAGVTMNLAPVADVASQNYSLGERAFGARPEGVGLYVNAAIKAARDNDITPVLKHWPGLGTTTKNTDVAANVATIPWRQLQQRGDLIPYHMAAKLSPNVMVSNAIVPGLSAGQPASLSAPAIKQLRAMPGYKDAVVMTDSLNAKSILDSSGGSLTPAEATVKAFEADEDIALLNGPANGASWATFFDRVQQDVHVAIQNRTYSSKALNNSVRRILDDRGVFDPGSDNFDKDVLQHDATAGGTDCGLALEPTMSDDGIKAHVSNDCKATKDPND